MISFNSDSEGGAFDDESCGINFCIASTSSSEAWVAFSTVTDMRNQPNVHQISM
jgi:hypothetical protein